MTIGETVNELDELTMYVEHAFTEEHKCKSFEALQMAIKALEKQTPKEPYFEGDGYANGELVYDIWRCPNCDKSYELEIDEFDYCPNCGQKIKWE